MDNKIEFKVCNQGKNTIVYEECEEFIKKWQKLMRIQDWEINLRFLSGIEMFRIMGDDKFIGCIDRDVTSKEANLCINIEHPEINEQLENTILHELVHIQTYEYEILTESLVAKSSDSLIDEQSKNVLEQMVNIITCTYENIIKEVRLCNTDHGK